MNLKRFAPVLLIAAGLAQPAVAQDDYVPNDADALGSGIFYSFELEQFEYRGDLLNDESGFAFEGEVHGDTAKQGLALLFEGELGVAEEAFEDVELQGRYRRQISDFWDVHLGVRHDIRPQPQRTFGLLGVSGLAPQFIEVDATGFVSQTGQVSGRLEAEYDLLLTQKLVFQPLVEIDVAATDDEPSGVGAGLSTIELGGRLRYEATRDIRPYIGINFEQAVFRTAAFARDEGEATEEFSVVVGIGLSF